VICSLVVATPAVQASILLRGAGLGDTVNAANPIRKVVTMLQSMQKEVTAEGEKEKNLFEKFKCYCKTNLEELSQSVEELETKVPPGESDIEAARNKHASLQEGLKQQQSDRASVKSAMAEANALRKKEAEAYAQEREMMTANIDAINKALVALKAGRVGFLQSPAAKLLQQLVANYTSMDNGARQIMSAFLSGTHTGQYAPKSWQIIGVLKQMKTEMQKSAAQSKSSEESSKKVHEELMAAKDNEAQVLTKSIEDKLSRAGELGVELENMKDDISDEKKALVQDTKMLADLKEECTAKSTEWEERSKLRAQELVAIAETIKMLSSDDALELFKATLPSSSLMQMDDTSREAKSHALVNIRHAQDLAPNSVDLDFVALALQGKEGGMEKVIKLIDRLIENLGSEQADDDRKQQFCVARLDSSSGKIEVLQRKMSDRTLTIQSMQEAVQDLKDGIEKLVIGIKGLIQSLKDAGEQRKKENSETTQLLLSNSQAKQLLKLAIKRLNKFYGRAGQEGADDAGLLQISAHVLQQPPAASYGEYKKKQAEGGSVVLLIKTLIQELEEEDAEAKTAEETAQKEYEKLVQDSARKRSADVKSVNTKQTALANLDSELNRHAEEKAADSQDYMALVKYNQALHGDCDWLVKYYSVRKEARTGEVDSLRKAKDVLAGADATFIQSKPQVH